MQLSVIFDISIFSISKSDCALTALPSNYSAGQHSLLPCTEILSPYIVIIPQNKKIYQNKTCPEGIFFNHISKLNTVKKYAIFIDLRIQKSFIKNQ